MDAKMKRLKNPLLTEKYTYIEHDSEEYMTNNVPHNFDVLSKVNDGEILGGINFQEGPIKEAGVNGVMNEDLIAMVITRLEHFQKTGFACRENQMAITKLEEALLWLRKRTMGQEAEGKEGTHEK